MSGSTASFVTGLNLTFGEREIFTLLVAGILRVDELSQKLAIDPAEVSERLKTLFAKTGVDSAPELMTHYLEHLVSELQDCSVLSRKPRVVLVDDEAELCGLVASSLRNKGVEVYAFTDPQAALKEVRALKPDMLIVDIRMPGMGGIELARKISELMHYSPSLLIMSGNCQEVALQQVSGLGAVSVLEKPVDMKKLFQTVVKRFVDDAQDRDRSVRLQDRLPLVVAGSLSLVASDIGSGGVFIRVGDFKHPLLVGVRSGDRISFTCSLDDGTSPIAILGEVAWIRTENENGLESGMGVKFVNLPQEHRRRVDDYLRARRISSVIPHGGR